MTNQFLGETSEMRAKWVPGTIIGTISPRNYDVQVGDVVWKRHEEQLRTRFIPSNQFTNLQSVSHPEMLLETDIQEHLSDMSSPVPFTSTTSQGPLQTYEEVKDLPKDDSMDIEPSILTEDSSVTPSTAFPDSPYLRRYPQRNRKPPDRFY